MSPAEQGDKRDHPELWANTRKFYMDSVQAIGHDGFMQTTYTSIEQNHSLN